MFMKREKPFVKTGCWSLDTNILGGQGTDSPVSLHKLDVGVDESSGGDSELRHRGYLDLLSRRAN